MTNKEKAKLSDLYMIKEGDEMVQSPGSRQIYKKYSKISSLSERSASTSNIDKELLNKPTENIVTQCKTNPFLRSKLNYLLKSEAEHQKKSTFLQHKLRNGEADWQKTTLKKEVSSIKQLQDEKLLEISKRLGQTKHMV